MGRYIFAAYVFALAYLHYIDPTHFDALMLGLLLFPAAPFLRDFVESFEVPGLKLKFRKQAKIAAGLIHASLRATRTQVLPAHTTAFIQDATDNVIDDYNDRIWDTAIELQRSANDAAKRNNLPTDVKLAEVLASLFSKGLVSAQFYGGMSQLVGLLNKVLLQGDSVDDTTSKAMLDAGREAKEVLDAIPAAPQ